MDPHAEAGHPVGQPAGGERGERSDQVDHEQGGHGQQLLHHCGGGDNRRKARFRLDPQGPIVALALVRFGQQPDEDGQAEARERGDGEDGAPTERLAEHSAQGKSGRGSQHEPQIVEAHREGAAGGREYVAEPGQR